uniref:Transmembrane protein n=1 Tax=Strongyloides venezuelensis TaxID=75913 RepID=A0A0K0EXJ3_STRVS
MLPVAIFYNMVNYIYNFTNNTIEVVSLMFLITFYIFLLTPGLCNRLEVSIYDDRRIPTSEKVLFFYIMKAYKTLVIWLTIGVLFLVCTFALIYCKELVVDRCDE